VIRAAATIDLAHYLGFSLIITSSECLIDKCFGHRQISLIHEEVKLISQRRWRGRSEQQGREYPNGPRNSKGMRAVVVCFHGGLAFAT
jgi:hypothetical protein